jgi:hypothetical protein
MASLKSTSVILIMKFICIALLIIFTWTQCSDKKIEVSDIYMTDNLGILIGNLPNDTQWKNGSFSNSELVLFNELDTANLPVTQLPVISTSSYGFPNPFTNHIAVSTTLSQPLNGEIVLKFVVVDDKMNSVQKGCTRIYVTSAINFLVAGNFSPGRYRLYFTYSVQGNEHFFKSWGNIQKL